MRFSVSLAKTLAKTLAETPAKTPARTLAKHLVLPALALFLTAVPPALAQATDTGKLVAACGGAQDFLLGEVPEGTDIPAVMQKLCACLATEFSGFPQAEVDVLTTDLDGTATEESHIAFGDYATLMDKAAAGLDKCMSEPDLAALVAPPVPPAESPMPNPQPTLALAPDTADFSAKCLASARLLDTLASATAGAGAARIAVCGCLVAELSTKTDQAGIDLLAIGFDHPLTAAEKAAYSDPAALETTANTAFTTCTAAAGVK